MDINENTYREYFTNFFKELEEHYRSEWLHNKPEDEVMPGEITLMKAHKAKFPPSFIKILRLRINKNQYPDAENEVYHVIWYVFNDNSFQVDYSGEYSLYKIADNKKLRQEWQIDDGFLASLENCTLRGYSDFKAQDWWCIDVLPYDILSEQRKYKFDFLQSFNSTFKRQIRREFSDEIDYNAKYNLQADPIFSCQELYENGGTPYSITEYDTGITRAKTFEDVQLDVANILLIPSVPAEVKQIFNAAKKLYVYSYMEYYFATVAMHYAYLALESALTHKYNQVFADDIKAEKEGKKLNARTAKPIKSTLKILEKHSLIQDHKKIFNDIVEPEFLSHSKKQNNKQEIRLEEIIKKLAQKGVIPKNEVELYNISRYFRNKLSHPVKPSAWLPNYACDAIYMAARDINYLFDENK